MVLAVLVALFAGLACPHRLLGTSALSSVHVARVELKIRMQPAGKLQLDPKKTKKNTHVGFFSGTEVAPEWMPGVVLGLQPHPGTEEGWRSPIKPSRTAIQSSPSVLAGQNYVLFFFFPWSSGD